MILRALLLALLLCAPALAQTPGYGPTPPVSGGYIRQTTGANATFGTLPGNAYISGELCRETAGFSVNVGVGSTSGGTDVLSPIAIPASGTTSVALTAFSKAWFSATAPQTVYLSSASWGSASVICQLTYSQTGP